MGIGRYSVYEREMVIKKVQILIKVDVLLEVETDPIEEKFVLEMDINTMDALSASIFEDKLEFYLDLRKKQNERLGSRLIRSKVMTKYSTILTLLLRLRQVCSHSALVLISEKRSQRTKMVSGEIFENWVAQQKRIEIMNQKRKYLVNFSLDMMIFSYCNSELEIENTGVLTGCCNLIYQDCIRLMIEEMFN